MDARVTGRRLPRLLLLLLVLAVLLWSAIQPKDRFTWWLEVSPVLIALPLMIATARRFPLTPLLYAAVAVHMIILMVGGHYTYADMPLFNWLREAFHVAVPADGACHLGVMSHERYSN